MAYYYSTSHHLSVSILTYRGTEAKKMSAAIGNKYAIGNKGGRPPMWGSPDELENSVIDYFNVCEENKCKATITGLALHLGFESRQSMYDYGDKKEFSYIIKRAKLAVENSYENSGTPFDIFALKNMGWSDRSEIDHTTKGEAIGKPDLSKYTDDELRILAELQRKSGTSEA